MFKRVAPQVAQDSSGFIVQFTGRYCLQYKDAEITANVTVDDEVYGQLGPGVRVQDLKFGTALYPDTLRVTDANGGDEKPTDEMRKLILKRMTDGLEFLGVRYEVYEGPAP